MCERFDFAVISFVPQSCDSLVSGVLIFTKFDRIFVLFQSWESFLTFIKWRSIEKSDRYPPIFVLFQIRSPIIGSCVSVLQEKDDHMWIVSKKSHPYKETSRKWFILGCRVVCNPMRPVFVALVISCIARWNPKQNSSLLRRSMGIGLVEVQFSLFLFPKEVSHWEIEEQLEQLE